MRLSKARQDSPKSSQGSTRFSETPSDSFKVFISLKSPLSALYDSLILSKALKSSLRLLNLLRIFWRLTTRAFWGHTRAPQNYLGLSKALFCSLRLYKAFQGFTSPMPWRSLRLPHPKGPLRPSGAHRGSSGPLSGFSGLSKALRTSSKALWVRLYNALQDSFRLLQTLENFLRPYNKSPRLS